MNETKMNVNAGACMFVTELEGSTEDGMTINLKMVSKCPHVMKLASDMKTVDLMDSIATPLDKNPLMIKCGEYLAHAACPIPFAIVKICEAVGDLCLKKDVTMTYTL